MMQGVAPHVARALQNGNVKSLDLSRQSTGLTYPGYFDWPTTIKNTISKERISVLVVFLGANDTWDMVFGNNMNASAARNGNRPTRPEWRVSSDMRMLSISA
jgi:hypothetical protein